MNTNASIIKTSLELTSTLPVPGAFTYAEKRGVSLNSTNKPFLQTRYSKNKIYLESGSKTFGRKLGDLVFENDTLISKEHCRIHQQKFGVCYIEDLGSTNKTFLNNKALPAFAMIPLKNGDIIRFGKQSYIFRTEGHELRSPSNKSDVLNRLLSKLKN